MLSQPPFPTLFWNKSPLYACLSFILCIYHFNNHVERSERVKIELKMSFLQEELEDDQPPKFDPPPLVNCESCQGGCNCGYDSSQGGWCSCENACECPTCSPERKSHYKLYVNREAFRKKRAKDERAERNRSANDSCSE